MESPSDPIFTADDGARDGIKCSLDAHVAETDHKRIVEERLAQFEVKLTVEGRYVIGMHLLSWGKSRPVNYDALGCIRARERQEPALTGDSESG